jgi:opacity protein-like surface antigen
MKKQLLALAITSVVSTGVFAQAQNFQGFSVGISGSFVGNTTELTGGGTGLNVGDSNLIPTGEIGYTHAITDKFTLGISGTYDFTEANAGKISNNYQFKGKNHYSINLKPGFALSKDALVYALVGYNSLEGSISNVSGSTTFTGIGYGVGAQVMFTSNIYGKVEIQQVQYDSKAVLGNSAASAKVISNIGTVGIGYKF